MRRVRLLLLLILAAGCSERPRAPALRNDPVFDDPKSGLRFLAPSGWHQAARSDPPAKSADKEWLLVRYQAPPGEKPALFEVTFLDAPPSADVAALVKAPSHSMPEWKPVGRPEALVLNGVEAMRYTLACKPTTKESVVVRRDGRLYFLTSVFPTSDEHSRDLARDSVRSATWTR